MIRRFRSGLRNCRIAWKQACDALSFRESFFKNFSEGGDAVFDEVFDFFGLGFHQDVAITLIGLGVFWMVSFTIGRFLGLVFGRRGGTDEGVGFLFFVSGVLFCSWFGCRIKIWRQILRTIKRWAR